MEAVVYNLKAEKVDALELPEKIFGLKWNADLVHQVIEALRSNRRKGLAQVKDRGEVAGGGRKPWRQKGTGRARHGSIRSPIWIGGGVTHGPTGQKKYAKKINKKAKQKALSMIWARKNAEGEIMFVDEMRLPEAKTKKAEEALGALSRIKGFEGLAKKGTKIIVAPEDKKTHLAFRNINGLKVMEARNINPLDLLNARYVILGQKDILNLFKI
ncbi:MAG: 50S ribosomal protein L4 [Candidatus Niyogibacteria bacterium]|nr:50S ribosomal protein L4 [Candidatus Niyogibacteria bacterium]